MIAADQDSNKIFATLKRKVQESVTKGTNCNSVVPTEKENCTSTSIAKVPRIILSRLNVTQVSDYTTVPCSSKYPRSRHNNHSTKLARSISEMSSPKVTSAALLDRRHMFANGFVPTDTDDQGKPLWDSDEDDDDLEPVEFLEMMPEYERSESEHTYSIESLLRDRIRQLPKKSHNIQHSQLEVAEAKAKEVEDAESLSEQLRREEEDSRSKILRQPPGIDLLRHRYACCKFSMSNLPLTGNDDCDYEKRVFDQLRAPASHSIITSNLCLVLHISKRRKCLLDNLLRCISLHPVPSVVDSVCRCLSQLLKGKYNHISGCNEWYPLCDDLIDIIFNYGVQGNEKEPGDSVANTSATAVAEKSANCPDIDINSGKLNCKASAKPTGSSNSSSDTYCSGSGSSTNGTSPHQHCISALLKVIRYSCSYRSCFSASDLKRLLQWICKLALDTRMLKLPILHDFRACIHTLISSFDDHLFKLVGSELLMELLQITDHHHNMLYLVSLFLPLDERTENFQQALAFFSLKRLVTPLSAVSSHQLHWTLGCIYELFIGIDWNDSGDLYRLYTLLNLFSLSIGTTIHTDEKVLLEDLHLRISTLSCKMKDNLLKPDVTKCKSLMHRISLKWACMVKAVKSAQELLDIDYKCTPTKAILVSAQEVGEDLQDLPADHMDNLQTNDMEHIDGKVSSVLCRSPNDKLDQNVDASITPQTSAIPSYPPSHHCSDDEQLERASTPKPFVIKAEGLETLRRLARSMIKEIGGPSKTLETVTPSSDVSQTDQTRCFSPPCETTLSQQSPASATASLRNGVVESLMLQTFTTGVPQRDALVPDALTGALHGSCASFHQCRTGNADQSKFMATVADVSAHPYASSRIFKHSQHGGTSPLTYHRSTDLAKDDIMLYPDSIQLRNKAAEAEPMKVMKGSESSILFFKRTKNCQEELTYLDINGHRDRKDDLIMYRHTNSLSNGGTQESALGNKVPSSPSQPNTYMGCGDTQHFTKGLIDIHLSKQSNIDGHCEEAGTSIVGKQSVAHTPWQRVRLHTPGECSNTETDSEVLFVGKLGLLSPSKPPSHYASCDDGERLVSLSKRSLDIDSDGELPDLD